MGDLYCTDGIKTSINSVHNACQTTNDSIAIAHHIYVDIRLLKASVTGDQW